MNSQRGQAGQFNPDWRVTTTEKPVKIGNTKTIICKIYKKAKPKKCYE